jgi:hypothetical protein
MNTPVTTLSKVSGTQVHGFCFAIYDLGQIHPVDRIDHLCHQPIHVRAVGPYSRYPHVETLPIVLVSNFRYRHIKAILDPIFNGSNDPALFL